MPFGGGSVIVRGRICWQERTPLVIVNGNLTAQRYIDDILRPTVLPFLQQQPRGVIYQHDNARSHTAGIVQTSLGANNVNVLPWPAFSPDTSPIEHLWDVVDRRVRQHPHPSVNQQGSIQALQREWPRIPRDLSR